MSNPSTRSPDEGGGSAAPGVSEQARQFAGDVKYEAQNFAEDGKARGAERLKGVADTVDRVADQVADQSPAMADWVRKAANELDGVSRSLKDKSVGDLLRMGRDFAKSEPAAFIAGAAFAGFALSRLLKSTTPTATVKALSRSQVEAAQSGALQTGFAPTSPDVAGSRPVESELGETPPLASSSSLDGVALSNAMRPDDGRPSGRASVEGAHSI